MSESGNLGDLIVRVIAKTQQLDDLEKRLDRIQRKLNNGIVIGARVAEQGRGTPSVAPPGGSPMGMGQPVVSGYSPSPAAMTGGRGRKGNVQANEVLGVLRRNLAEAEASGNTSLAERHRQQIGMIEGAMGPAGGQSAGASIRAETTRMRQSEGVVSRYRQEYYSTKERLARDEAREAKAQERYRHRVSRAQFQAELSGMSSAAQADAIERRIAKGGLSDLDVANLTKQRNAALNRAAATGGIGAASTSNPRLMSTGIMMSAMFGGWEVASAANAYMQTGTAMRLTRDPLKQFQIAQQGINQVGSGILGSQVLLAANGLDMLAQGAGPNTHWNRNFSNIQAQEVVAAAELQDIATERMAGKLKAQISAGITDDPSKPFGMLQGLQQSAMSQFLPNDKYAAMRNQVEFDDINRRQDIAVTASALSSVGVKRDVIDKFEASANLFADAILKGQRANISFSMGTDKMQLAGQRDYFRKMAGRDLAGASDVQFENEIALMERTADPTMRSKVLEVTQAMRQARAGEKIEGRRRLYAASDIVSKGRGSSFAAEMAGIDEEERQALQSADDEGDEAVGAYYDSLRKSARANRRFRMRQLSGDVEEARLRADGQFGASAFRAMGNDILERASAPGTDKKEGNLILQAGAYDVQAQMQQLLNGLEGQEFNPLAKSFAPETGKEDLGALLEAATDVLKEIRDKIGNGTVGP